MDLKKITVILVHAFAGWAACGATMGIGMAALSLKTALMVHVAGAPLFFAVVSYLYFRKFNYTSPLVTAVIFVCFVILVDFFFVALLINHSLDMFSSPLGTWIPFAMIFTSTYITGLVTGKKAGQR